MSELRKAIEVGRRVGDEDPDTKLREGESVTTRRESRWHKESFLVYLAASTEEGNTVPFKFRASRFQLTRLAGDRNAVRPGLYRRVRITAQAEYDKAKVGFERGFTKPTVSYAELQSNSEMVTDIRVGPSLVKPDAPAFYIEVQNAEGLKVVVFAEENGVITRMSWDDRVKINTKLYEKLFNLAQKELRRIGVAA